MFKNLTQVYCLIVCLVASIVMMVTIGIMLGSGTDIVLTEYKYISQLSKFSSDEKYLDYRRQLSSEEKERQQKVNPELIKGKRIAARADYINEVKGNAISSLISCLTWLVTALFFFVIHWRMYKCSVSNKGIK